jgi:hypothetical protein
MVEVWASHPKIPTGTDYGGPIETEQVKIRRVNPMMLDQMRSDINLTTLTAQPYRLERGFWHFPSPLLLLECYRPGHTSAKDWSTRVSRWAGE